MLERFFGLISAFTASAEVYSGDYDYSSYVNLGDYIVKTDEEGAMPAMTKNQLKTAIEKCYSGQMQENCISVLDDIVDVQNKYKVNAAFILAVAQKESTCGTGWDSIDPDSYNWMSISYGSTWNGDSGKTCSGGGYTWCWYDSYNEAVQKYGIYMTEHDYYFFAHGEYSVAQIAPHFAGTEWEKYVKEYLDNLYSAVAETLPSTYGGNGYEAAEGDGYTKTYTCGSKIYRLYEQWDGSYKGNSYGGSTISSCGCGPSCVSIIISGYGINKNPGNVVSECTNETIQNRAMTINAVGAYLNHYGLKYTQVGADGYSFTEADKKSIINHLKAGNPVILLIHSPVVLINGSKASTSNHYVTLLGINSKNEIFVGDPGSSYTDGFTTMDSLCNQSLATNYFLVSK